MIDLRINPDLVRKILVGFIRSEVRRVGYERAVIGLSGGIDSALAAVLAVEALGPANVLAVCMPHRISSPDSLAHAILLVEKLGVAALTFDITPLVDPLVDRFAEAGNLRRGNAMARARMLVLYDQSAAFNGLVIGTGNKTEILLGYTTQFGDAACAINPIGDLYKTQIRQLAEALDIPESIRAKAPSADLWEGQTDEGELGFTYAEVDRLLFLLVDERYSPEACIEAGFAPDFVTQVVRRIQRNHYKRILAPIAKLSNRTVGSDFLYLRDWGT